MLEATYADAGVEATWNALHTMGALFSLIGRKVAESTGFSYPREEDAKVRAYLRYVQSLPRDGEER